MPSFAEKHLKKGQQGVKTGDFPDDFMRKLISSVLKIITTTLVSIAVLIAIMLVGMRIFGFRLYTVLSGSMEPLYHVGSLIYVKEVDVTDLKKGDVITFMLGPNTTATHRIYEVVPDEDNPDIIRFRTKGDANNDVDKKLVHGENVIGKPVFSIPYMGYLANYIQQPPGIYVAIGVAALVVMLVFCADGLTDDKKELPASSKDAAQPIPEGSDGEPPADGASPTSGNRPPPEQSN